MDNRLKPKEQDQNKRKKSSLNKKAIFFKRFHLLLQKLPKNKIKNLWRKSKLLSLTNPALVISKRKSKNLLRRLRNTWKIY